MKLRKMAKKYGAKVAVASSFLGMSAVAKADLAADIAALSAAANTNQTLLATALISLAGIMFGVGMILYWLKK